MKIPGGYIVAIEGIDAVGKNTHSLMLAEWLRGRDVAVARMSFPDYDTQIGKEIKAFLSGRRTYPKELQHLLFAANRWEKLDEIESRLRAGEAVIVNRYSESNLAYGMANGLEAGWLANLEKGMPKANLVILLDAAPHALTSRRPAGDKDVYEKSSAMQTKAQKTYRELARENDWSRIDASGPVEDVQADVVKTTRAALRRDKRVSI
jgi:dTMP kinase